MGDVGSRVEKPVDAVAAVALDHGESVGLSVLLDDVSQLSVTNARLHCGTAGNGESKEGEDFMSSVLNRSLKINRTLTNSVSNLNQKLSICTSYTSVILTTCV